MRAFTCKVWLVEFKFDKPSKKKSFQITSQIEQTKTEFLTNSSIKDLDIVLIWLFRHFIQVTPPLNQSYLPPC